MNATKPGLLCRWAGCPEEFDNEVDWVKHVAVHVFTLQPGERTPWLGPPELDPDLRHDSPVDDNQLDGEDDDDDDRAFSQINALSSPASTPPQVELPDSPDLAAKINGPSASMIAPAEPLGLISADTLERALSHRTSASADDVEADLIPTSPTPSINASQNSNTNSTQGPSLHPHLLSHPPPVFSQTQFPSASVSRFRRGVFQMFPRSQPWMNASQSQNPSSASQTLRSPNGSQANGNGISWLNTQAFRPPETQDLYESD